MPYSLKPVIAKTRLAFQSLWRELLLALPDEFSKYRVSYYNRYGACIARGVSISTNVRIRGFVEIGEGSSVAQNCSISGFDAGVQIGRNVMIAPNVVIVAFSHAMEDVSKPIALQPLVQAPVVIEDGVWISANCTIGMGIKIGQGAVVGANSFVNRNVEPFTVVGGVPARFLRSRC